MLFLLLAILGSALNGILLKWSSHRGRQPLVVIAANYLSASTIGWLFFWSGNPHPPSGVTVAMAGFGGFLWPAAFWVWQWGIAEYGLSVAATAARLSLLVPIAFAFLFWEEVLSTFTLAGMVCALCSLLLISPGQGKTSSFLDRQSVFYIFLLVISLGLLSLWLKVFNHYGPSEEHGLFVTLIFTFSIPFAWGYVKFRRLPIDRLSVRDGLLMGCSNFGAIYGLLLALGSPEFLGISAVVYTLHSVSVILLAVGAGVFFWKEHLTRLNYTGVGLAMLAVVLLQNG